MKKDIRIYLDEEYSDYLKKVAEQEGVSLNRLVVSVIRKKYPMPRKKEQGDTEALRNQLNEITAYLDAAQSGGPKVKPYNLYLYLQSEQERLRQLLGE